MPGSIDLNVHHKDWQTHSGVTDTLINSIIKFEFFTILLTHTDNFPTQTLDYNANKMLRYLGILIMLLSQFSLTFHYTAQLLIVLVLIAVVFMIKSVMLNGRI